MTATWCRSLGFPHYTVIDPLPNPAHDDSDGDPYGYGGYACAPYGYTPREEEAEEEQQRFWLRCVSYEGPEEKSVDCDIGAGFRSNNAAARATRSA